MSPPTATRAAPAADAHKARRRKSGNGSSQGSWRRFWTPKVRRRIGPWLALVFLALVVWLIADHVREIEWGEVRKAVVAYPLATLATAAALVIASHFAYACYDLLARRYVGHKLATRAVLATAFISYAFNLNLGPWVGGFGFRIRL